MCLIVNNNTNVCVCVSLALSGISVDTGSDIRDTEDMMALEAQQEDDFQVCVCQRSNDQRPWPLLTTVLMDKQ